MNVPFFMLDIWVKSWFWSNNGAYVYASVWIHAIFGMLLCVQRGWDISTHASSFSVDLFFPRFVCCAWTVLNNSFFILLNGIFYVILWILCLHDSLHAFSVMINCAYHISTGEHARYAVPYGCGLSPVCVGVVWRRRFLSIRVNRVVHIFYFNGH